MHELPYEPPDYGSSEGTSLFPCRPTVKHRSHSLQRKALICELAGSAVWLRSLRCTVRAIVAVAPFVCQIAVSALFMPSVRAQTLSQIDVLMAYGRCLRPALYSSLRSSPSHPTGVSALRVTIAIANARFARKQWGLRRSIAKSRRLFRNQSATSRRVGQALLEDLPHDSNCILSQIAASTESLLAWQLGRGNQRPRTARTAREKRRLRSGACG